VLPIVLAGICALVWGTADFSGGKATQRGSALAVAVMSQLLGLPVLAISVLLVPGTPSLADLGWGVLAGTAGFVGIVLLYRGLASGAMAVVAPITAVTAALVPIVVGLVIDRSPGALALTGAGCAVIAIALVSVGPTGSRSAVTGGLIGLALASGAMFGLFFVLLGQSSPDAGMWPLLGVRVGSIVLGLLVAARTGTSLRLPPRALAWAAIAGPLDVAANAFYLAAVGRGDLVVVGPIASLYPASTVLLALAVDRERLRVVQVAGLGLAAAALVLTAS
jgi:drug/metabolite transporter (DMT)-like permease